MHILVIGGTGFIGPFVVRQLADLGHRVTVLTRSSQPFDLPAEQVTGERQDLAARQLKPDVVIDLILSSGRQAQDLMGTFRGVAGRVVAASSIDVYRACGVAHGTEPGGLLAVPLDEDSALRSNPQTYPAESLEAMKKIFNWVDAEYDKIPVERAILNHPELPGTVLRLPMIYGPGDKLARLHGLRKRMDDQRPFILLEKGWAQWRAPRGYVENVAAAITLAALSPSSANRVYNFAEQPAFSELEWAGQVAKIMHWPGRLLLGDKDDLPPYLAPPGNSAQSWEASSARIRTELGYREPVPLDEALRRTLDWDREHPPVDFNPHVFDYAAEDAAAERLAAVTP